MNFQPLGVSGVFMVQPELVWDERGYFARTWSREEFEAYGLDGELVQCNVSLNRNQGTIRGLHYQQTPYEETKLIRCTRGRIYDVVVDVRDGSPTQWQWTAVVLEARKLQLLLVPGGCAHGFQTLVGDTEVAYQMSREYHSSAARGLRWDDPVLAIPWPLADPIVSPRDRSHPLLKRE